MSDEVLVGYLQNHWVLAYGGTATFRRVARTHPDKETAESLRRLLPGVEADQESLRSIMEHIGADVPVIGTVLARIGEQLGRLKPNGRLLTRSPLTDIVEVEALHLAETARTAGWELLLALAAHNARLDADRLEELRDRSRARLAELERLRLRIGVKRAGQDRGAAM